MGFSERVIGAAANAAWWLMDTADGLRGPTRVEVDRGLDADGAVPDSVRVVVRRAAASVAFEAVRGRGAVGGGVLWAPASTAGAVSFVTPAIGIGVGASLRHTRWVDWAVWVKNHDATLNARQLSLYATRELLAWRLWVRPREHAAWLFNTPRRGHASWARIFFGRRHQRLVGSRSVDGEVSLPEGKYKAIFTFTVTESWRDRMPWSRALTHSTSVEVPVGVSVPYGRPGTAAQQWLRYRFESAASAVETAASKVQSDVAEMRGKDWSLAPRFRSLYDTSFAPRGGVEPVVAWEARDPLTGVWTTWGMARRSELPAGAIVEPRSVPNAVLLGIGLMLGAGVAAFGSVMSDADRV